MFPLESTTLTLGKVLAFNDLPSTVKLSLDFESGRNLGSQEIFQKLNAGKERSYFKLKYSDIELMQQKDFQDKLQNLQTQAVSDVDKNTELKNTVSQSVQNNNTTQIDKMRVEIQTKMKDDNIYDKSGIDFEKLSNDQVTSLKNAIDQQKSVWNDGTKDIKIRK